MPALDESTTPGVLFLGVAERAAYVRDGESNIYKWNVLGLKNVVLTHIFPVPLNGHYIGIAVSGTAMMAGGNLKFRIVHESGAEAGTFDLQLVPVPGQSIDPVLQFAGIVLPLMGSIVLFTQLPASTPLLAMLPGTYEIRQVKPQQEIAVGQLHFAAVDPVPLSEERIAAIRSDPTASKAVRIELTCRYCDAKCRAYAALDKTPAFESAGWNWYQDLPDVFSCSCGKTTIPLVYLRRNLHGLLGANFAAGAEAQFTPIYERGALQTVRSTFSRLLVQGTAEERLQEFLRDNPILFHQFAAVRLFAKPPILTFFVADFALLTPKKELLFIELEKSRTRLMNKNGGIAAPLSHAFDQVRDWLHVIDEHRLAVLETLKIERNEVGAIRGIVIAGRDAGYDALHLRRLKAEDRGRVTFYTYDDLLFALSALSENIDHL